MAQALPDKHYSTSHTGWGYTKRITAEFLDVTITQHHKEHCMVRDGGIRNERDYARLVVRNYTRHDFGYTLGGVWHTEHWLNLKRLEAS